MAIVNFKNDATKDINYGRKTKESIKLLPAHLHVKAQVKLAKIGAATSISDLYSLRGNRLEMLKGDRIGQYSIRINDRYRICFYWKELEACDVEIVDYHG